MKLIQTTLAASLTLSGLAMAAYPSASTDEASNLEKFSQKSPTDTVTLDYLNVSGVIQPVEAPLRIGMQDKQVRWTDGSAEDMLWGSLVDEFEDKFEALGASTSWDASPYAVQGFSGDGSTRFCTDLAEAFATAEMAGVPVETEWPHQKNEEVKRLRLAYKLAKINYKNEDIPEEVKRELGAVRRGIDAAYEAHKGQNEVAYMAACTTLQSRSDALKRILKNYGRRNQVIGIYRTQHGAAF